MSADQLLMVFYLGAAWLAGSLIGLERSYHGRPAGFRTHALVCLASALLMMVTTHQGQWFGASVPASAVTTDPTRMAQGIMTGIGFLGAGVIFKEGLTVRGLTTAASIWMTAALGILYGIGFLFPAILVTIVTLVTLSLFRWMESRMPSQHFADHMLSFAVDSALDEASMRELIHAQGFRIKSLSYRLVQRGTVYEYHMTLQTLDRLNFGRLAEALRGRDGVLEFRLAPLAE
ncbi:putative Mg2+ transporter-C (MgtC) family protein [Franzmannia pantelleriensis]|uniref:Protein MgtC n=1 Tax=Franzmannia pantelleriensis TaxID=48727 RepID=A0A1G9K641_9GAMM|nr:MgtC/SapB family protein [Halomonas pantelleriensis]SDL45350.1 putative Mg2+ transporter-C (MgtC) family protein [Halomonas pantelleriensis]